MGQKPTKHRGIRPNRLTACFSGGTAKRAAHRAVSSEHHRKTADTVRRKEDKRRVANSKREKLQFQSRAANYMAIRSVVTVRKRKPSIQHSAEKSRQKPDIDNFCRCSAMRYLVDEQALSSLKNGFELLNGNLFLLLNAFFCIRQRFDCWIPCKYTNSFPLLVNPTFRVFV